MIWGQVLDQDKGHAALGIRRHGERSQLYVGAFRTDYEDFIETKVRIGVDPASGRLLFQSRYHYSIG